MFASHCHFVPLCGSLFVMQKKPVLAPMHGALLSLCLHFTRETFRKGPIAEVWFVPLGKDYLVISACDRAYNGIYNRHSKQHDYAVLHHNGCSAQHLKANPEQLLREETPCVSP